MRKKPVYDLVVHIARDTDTGEMTFAFSKGHFTPEQFCAAAQEQEDLDIKPEDVRQSYMRYEIGPGPDGWCLLCAEKRKPGKGIFPITCTDL